MTGYVFTAGGASTQLPAPVSWTFQYTAGVPCDSFQLRCIWEGENAVQPAEWATFQALEGSEVKFTGVVDECETVRTSEGSYFEVSGRGMAARLLDNEALSQDYEIATLADILRDHVTPYGVYNGIYPRFDQLGQLILIPWSNEARVVLDSTVPVTRLVCRDRRYGVLSQVVVRDRYQDRTETVNNTSFQALGGRRRQVVTMPGKSQYQAMRYSGQFQLEQSAAEQLRVEVEVPKLFFAKPGDLVQLAQPDWARNGQYRVAQAQVGQDERGAWTVLELAPPDMVL